MEFLDIFNENNEFLGYSAERKKAHESNLWHRHVSCWIMNNDGDILMQQRAYSKNKNPGMWAKTGGHVDAGETVEQAIQREVYEEIGLKVNADEIINIEIFKSKNLKENYYSYGYIVFTKLKEEDFVLQKEEVNAVKYFTIEELEQLKQDNNENFTFYKWNIDSFNEQMKILKKYRKTLNN